MHYCQNCPGLQPLIEFLLRELYDVFADEKKQTIWFQERSQTQQFELISRTENIIYSFIISRKSVVSIFES